MPTVVLLDVSASILRPADPSDVSTTRQDIAQRGVLHLLQWMETWQENEPISLMTFSSSCRVLRPFGTSHSELRKALYEIESEDGARVSQAVSAASNYLQDHCGLDAPGSQIVIVADGDCPFDDVPELEAAAAAFQPSTTVHVVAMGTDAELSRCDAYRSIVERTGGMFAGVRMPTPDAAAHKKAFSTIARRFFSPYRGSLVYGHVTCKIMLYPDPNLGLDGEARGDEGGGHAGGGGGQHGSSRQILMPSTIAVRGFVSNTLFGRWPQKGAGGEVMSEYVLHQTSVQSRHAIYPDVRVGDPKSDGDAPPAAVVKDASAGDSTPNSPQLVHSLLKAMTDEGLVAVCHLKSHSSTSSGKEGRDTDCVYMVPTICPVPGGGPPIIRPILVVPRVDEETGICPLHLLAETPSEDIAGYDLLSYFPEKPAAASDTLPSPDTISADLNKFTKSVTGLPAKKAQAYNECEKLRRASLVYMMPCIRESAESILSKSLADVPGTGRDHTLAQFYINDMTEQLGKTQPIKRPKTPPQTGRRQKSVKGARDGDDESLSKASIGNLLS